MDTSISPPSPDTQLRIIQMIESIQKIATGEYDVRVAVSESHDNLDALATGINMLAEEIQTRIKETEKKVKELERLNDVFVDRESKMIELKNEIKQLKIAS